MRKHLHFYVEPVDTCRQVILDGGNAIDSAIATMYCNTVVNSHSMGIGEADISGVLDSPPGGGFIMTIYLANGTQLALIARETAPAAARQDMFHADENLTRYGEGAKLDIIILFKQTNLAH